MSLKTEIITELNKYISLTDKELSEHLGKRPQQINNECNYLARIGIIKREKNINNVFLNSMPCISDKFVKKDLKLNLWDRIVKFIYRNKL